MDECTDNDSSPVETLKHELRHEMLSRRKMLSVEFVGAAGESISAVLSKEDCHRQAHSIAVYAAAGGEPDLRALFDLGLRSGKTMLFPRCRDDFSLSFRVIDRWSDLVVGRFGLLEPPEDSLEIDVDGIDLVLVPSVAVDRHGGRLGRGGGWYDRTLPVQCQRTSRVVAVVHDFQVVERIPRGPQDRLVDAFVSESGFVPIQH